MDKYVFVSTEDEKVELYAYDVDKAYYSLRREHPKSKFKIKEIIDNNGISHKSVKDLRKLEGSFL